MIVSGITPAVDVGVSNGSSSSLISNPLDLGNGLDSKAGNVDFLGMIKDSASGMIDSMESSYNVIETAENGGVNEFSAPEMLDLQKKIDKFVVTTNIVSKVASLVNKSIDSLTKIQ